jgi:hypothetical protein
MRKCFGIHWFVPFYLFSFNHIKTGSTNIEVDSIALKSWTISVRKAPCFKVPTCIWGNGIHPSGTKVTCVGFISKPNLWMIFRVSFYIIRYKLLILDREHLDIVYDAHQDGMNGDSFCTKFWISVATLVNQVHSSGALRKVAILLILHLTLSLEYFWF